MPIIAGMRRGVWADGPGWAAVQAAAVHDVIKARRLVELGVPETTVYARCRPGGPWQLLLPGVVLLRNGTPDPQQLLVAALLYAGDEAQLTGLAAARRHGVRRGPASDGRLHLLVPHDRQPASTGFVVVERTRRLPEPVRRGGFPLAPVARAVMDGSRRLSDPRQVVELLSDAVQRGLCTVDELVTEVEAAQRQGTAIPRALLRDVDAGARSAAERDAQMLWRQTGLPEPWWNASVYGPDGALLGVADAWWDEIALVWEINSLTWHLSPRDYAREQAKTAGFAAAGVPVLPTIPTRLRSDRPRVIRELCAAHRHAAARPRPAVRAVPLPRIAAG